MTEAQTTQETPEQTETETQTQTETPVEEAKKNLVQRFVSDLREAGEVGKKQWEGVFAKTRELFKKRTPEAAEAVEGEAAEASAEPEKLTWETLRDRSRTTFTKAQDRGAELLIQLIGRVRVGIESIEKNLKQQREPEDETTAAAA